VARAVGNDVSFTTARVNLARSNMMPDAPVHIVPYDPAWPAMFELERKTLALVLREWVVGSIEHVGSTAVLGLSAKPVIDIMVGVDSLPASRPALPVVRELGYQYAEYKTDVMHWFCKPSFEVRTHHLHLVPYGAQLWRERLAFRDLLRTNPTVAAEYDALKRDLASHHRLGREAYTQAKSPFIARCLDAAISRARV
jgi:GrpB-like predicted nucleotidyltransferase (UPF0157 family)